MRTSVFNPYTGNRDIIDIQESGPPIAVDVAEKVADTFLCDVSVAVGDLVRADTATSDTVASISSNVYDDVVFGMVILKPTATTCQVLISGKASGLATSLVFGKVVWVGTDGKPSTTRPTTGHIQKIGISIKADTMFLLPSMEKVILT